METVKITHDVEIPYARGEIRNDIHEFLDSGHVNMKLECADKHESLRVYQRVAAAKKSEKLPIRIVKSANDIYVLREGDKG